MGLQTPDDLFGAFTEGSQCACMAAWDRGSHRLKAHTKAGLGRAWLLRVGFTLHYELSCLTKTFHSCHLVPHDTAVTPTTY